MNKLSLVLVELRREEMGGRTYRSGVRFYDFVVDGKSLREALRTSDIGVLSPMWASMQFGRMLLGEEREPLLEGRTAIYGCRECLDPLCGGLAVTVSNIGDRICWSEASRFHMDYGTIEDPTEAMQFTPRRVGPFEFDAAEYRALLAPFTASAD